MHATTLVIIYNYVLFGFRSNIIFCPIIVYDLRYSDLCVYLIRDPYIRFLCLPIRDPYNRFLLTCGPEKW